MGRRRVKPIDVYALTDADVVVVFGLLMESVYNETAVSGRVLTDYETRIIGAFREQNARIAKGNK